MNLSFSASSPVVATLPMSPKSSTDLSKTSVLDSLVAQCFFLQLPTWFSLWMLAAALCPLLVLSSLDSNSSFVASASSGRLSHQPSTFRVKPCGHWAKSWLALHFAGWQKGDSVAANTLEVLEGCLAELCLAELCCLLCCCNSAGSRSFHGSVDRFPDDGTLRSTALLVVAGFLAVVAVSSVI